MNWQQSRQKEARQLSPNPLEPDILLSYGPANTVKDSLTENERLPQVLSLQFAPNAELVLAQGGHQGTSALLASLFDKPPAAVRIVALPQSEPYSTEVLNLQKIMSVTDVPMALSLLRCPVMLNGSASQASTFVQRLESDKRWPGHRIAE